MPLCHRRKQMGMPLLSENNCDIAAFPKVETTTKDFLSPFLRRLGSSCWQRAMGSRGKMRLQMGRCKEGLGNEGIFPLATINRVVRIAITLIGDFRSVAHKQCCVTHTTENLPRRLRKKGIEARNGKFDADLVLFRNPFFPS